MEWLQIIFVFAMVNWFFALFSSLPTIIILYYYGLQSYIGTALAGFALAYTAFTLRNWHIISKFVTNKIEAGEVDNKINVISLLLMGITITIYSLIGIALHSEWIPFFIPLWDYYILEKGSWYLTITGWVNKTATALTRTKKDNIYKTVPVGILSFALLLRTLKRF